MSIILSDIKYFFHPTVQPAITDLTACKRNDEDNQHTKKSTNLDEYKNTKIKKSVPMSREQRESKIALIQKDIGHAKSNQRSPISQRPHSSTGESSKIGTKGEQTSKLPQKNQMLENESSNNEKRVGSDGAFSKIR